MTVYVDVSAAVNARAGLGRYAANIAHATAALKPGQVGVFYNQTREARIPSEIEGLPGKSVSVGYKPWRMAVWMAQLTGVGFNRLLPDATCFHATEHLLMPLRGVPSVLTVHDLIYHRFPQHHKRLNYWYLNAAMPLYVRRADAIVAISEATRRDLIELYGTPPDKISVIYEAAAPHFAPPPPDPRPALDYVRARYALPARYLITLGTVEPRKNLPRLLEALAQLRPDHPDLALVVVGGRGWLYGDFFNRIDSLGLTEHVRVLGYVPDDELSPLFWGAVAAVVPSLYEGFGLPVLEAMACGCPVVSSNAASLPEVGGEAARYFDPADVEAMRTAIDAVTGDEKLRARMRAAGLEQAARFSWERAARETWAVYEKVIGG